jgi:hypothetical protein
MMMARTHSRFLEAVDVRNVGMVQRGERLGFPGESGKAVRISGKGVGQDLQRDIAIELRIAGPKHLPHSPFADRRGDVVAAKSGARRKGQVLGLNGPGGAGMQIVGKRSMCGNASASKAAQPARPRLKRNRPPNIKEWGNKRCSSIAVNSRQSQPEVSLRILHTWFTESRGNNSPAAALSTSEVRGQPTWQSCSNNR